MAKRLKFEPASGGYNVMDGDRFIGRVKRSRDSYDHSNGRLYKFWAWSSFPVSGKNGRFGMRTMAAAAKHLVENFTYK